MEHKGNRKPTNENNGMIDERKTEGGERETESMEKMLSKRSHKELQSLYGQGERYAMHNHAKA